MMNDNLLRVLSCATLLLGTVNNASYTMEDNAVQENEQLLNYKSIAKCLQSKCTPNELNEIICEVNKNYDKICEFFKNKKKDILDDKDIEFGNSILKNSEIILNKVLSICGFNIDVEFYIPYKNSADKLLKKYQELSSKSLNIGDKKNELYHIMNNNVLPGVMSKLKACQSKHEKEIIYASYKNKINTFDMSINDLSTQREEIEKQMEKIRGLMENTMKHDGMAYSYMKEIYSLRDLLNNASSNTQNNKTKAKNVINKKYKK